METATLLMDHHPRHSSWTTSHDPTTVPLAPHHRPASPPVPASGLRATSGPRPAIGWRSIGSTRTVTRGWSAQDRDDVEQLFGDDVGFAAHRRIANSSSTTSYSGPSGPASAAGVAPARRQPPQGRTGLDDAGVTVAARIRKRRGLEQPGYECEGVLADAGGATFQVGVGGLSDPHSFGFWPHRPIVQSSAAASRMARGP